MQDSRMFLNNHKFAISLDKLRRNIIHAYYTSSRAPIASLRTEHISNDTKDMLLDILGGKYNAKLFYKLKPDEQRLVSTFVRVLKIPGIDLTEFDKQYQARFEILQGEIDSGNDNVAVRKEYKDCIVRGISEGLIPRYAGLNMLFKISA